MNDSAVAIAIAKKERTITRKKAVLSYIKLLLLYVDFKFAYSISQPKDIKTNGHSLSINS